MGRDIFLRCELIYGELPAALICRLIEAAKIEMRSNNYYPAAISNANATEIGHITPPF